MFLTLLENSPASIGYTSPKSTSSNMNCKPDADVLLICLNINPADLDGVHSDLSYFLSLPFIIQNISYTNGLFLPCM